MVDLLTQGHVLTTSAVNVAEVLAGVRGGEESRTEFLLSRLRCYAMTLAIARRAGELKRLHALKGQTIALPDTIITATALEHELHLMTENTRDFPSADLRFCPEPGGSSEPC